MLAWVAPWDDNPQDLSLTSSAIREARPMPVCRLLPLTAALFLACGLGREAQAQVAIDQFNPAPAWSCINAGFATMSQTFTPTFDRLNYVELYLSGGSGSPIDGDFSVQVLRNGVLQRESERLVIPANSSAGAYHQFDFATEAYFSRNTQYELRLVNHSNSTYFAWCQS
jgi:hypothetical protein